MTKSLLIALVAMLALLPACQKEQVEPTTPVLSLAGQQTKARLTTAARWAVDELLGDGKLIYKRGQTNPAEVDLEVEWCRFANNGIFEVKNFGNPVIDTLYYKLDDANNQVIIGYDKAFKQIENWTIKTGTVASDRFDIEFEEGTETGLLKMVAIQ